MESKAPIWGNLFFSFELVPQINNEPGSRAKVILGGGYNAFLPEEQRMPMRDVSKRETEVCVLMLY